MHLNWHVFYFSDLKKIEVHKFKFKFCQHYGGLHIYMRKPLKNIYINVLHFDHGHKNVSGGCLGGHFTMVLVKIGAAHLKLLDFFFFFFLCSICGNKGNLLLWQERVREKVRKAMQQRNQEEESNSERLSRSLSLCIRGTNSNHCTTSNGWISEHNLTFKYTPQIFQGSWGWGYTVVTMFYTYQNQFDVHLKFLSCWNAPLCPGFDHLPIDFSQGWRIQSS